MSDIELEVHILNLRYKLVGFNAIKDFKEWLDNNASEISNMNGSYSQPTEAVEAAVGVC